MLPAAVLTNLDELTKLTEEASVALALAEFYNPEKLSFLGVHNELRNALFHVMKMVEVRDKKDEKNEFKAYNNEFNAAKSHLRRAGCDAYELLCISCIKDIEGLLVKYDHEDITIAFPGYYEIRKTALEVKHKVAEMKQNKDLKSKSVETLFEHYFNQAALLIEHVKRINEYIPAIIEIQREKRKKKWKEQLISVGIAVVIAAVAFVLGKLT